MKVKCVVKSKNIINFARAQRLGWVGHIERMPKKKECSRHYTPGNTF
jgi:hypothetical protein